MSTRQLDMACRDIRIEDTPCFRTFALQRSIHVGMKSRFVLTFGVCGGKISIPFGRECVAFLLSCRARWWWWWDPPLRKLSLPKLCLHQQCMYVSDGDTNIITFFSSGCPSTTYLHVLNGTIPLFRCWGFLH